MIRDIFKLCADSLRAFAKDKYGVKLKPAHAHELVAAYFGYATKNALIADKKFSVSNLPKAKYIVLIPEQQIDERRRELEGFSPELPDSYQIGESVYTALFQDKYWSSEYPPFRGFEKLAKTLIEESYIYNETFKDFLNIPVEHYVVPTKLDSECKLTVSHTYKSLTGESIIYGQSVVKLPRVAGHIAFGDHTISATRNTGNRKQLLKVVGGEYE